MTFCAREYRALAAVFVLAHAVAPARAAPFTSNEALKTAVDNCLDAVPSGLHCCSSGAADCGAAGSADMPDWDVSRVTSMYALFRDRAQFNADIGGWDVGAVTNMQEMFKLARDFNQDIGGWDVSSVRNMREMFYAHLTVDSSVGTFNQDIGGWDVSSVEDMSDMFYRHPAFMADITGWNVRPDAEALVMFNGLAWMETYHNCGYDSSHAACTGTYPFALGTGDGPPNSWVRVACYFPEVEYGISFGESDGCGWWADSSWDVHGRIALGTTCQPTCYSGYSPSGPTVCGDDGTLTTTTCHRNCDLTTAPANGNVGDCVDVAHNTSCDPGCAAGFAFSSSLTCSASVLTPSVVLCLNTTGGPCDASEAPGNGTVGTCTNALASGTICQPTCDLGFEASGFSYCDGGAYTAATCVAEATCDASAPPRNGGVGDCTSALASRTTCVPTCDPGFLLIGVTSCSRGTLVSARCAPPPPPPAPPASPPPPVFFVDDDEVSGHATAAPFVAFAFAVVAMTFGDGRH